MSFKKQGTDLNSNIKIITNDVKIIKQASEQSIVCPKCKQNIGKKIGNLYYILDKQLISLNGLKCPKCGK